MVTKVSTPDFSLRSSWKCKKGTKNGKTVYSFSSGPTTSTHTATFRYSVPSGAQITAAEIYADCSSPLSGFSVCRVNGSSFSGGAASVALAGNSGTLTAVFEFKANGTKKDESSHYAVTTFRDVYLRIEYIGEVVTATTPVQTASASGLSNLPPQNVCIYEQDTGKMYVFDGVVKIQHQISMKMEEEPSKHKDQYVNNARNEPDKLTLEIVMSDVYDGGGEIANSVEMDATQFDAYNASKSRISTAGETRSSNAYATLKELKESRRKLSIVTPQYVYTEMLIASLVVNQEEASPYGWQGQIVFQRAYDVVEKKKTTSTKKSADVKSDPSLKYQTGGVAIATTAYASGGSSNSSTKSGQLSTAGSKVESSINSIRNNSALN